MFDYFAANFLLPLKHDRRCSSDVPDWFSSKFNFLLSLNSFLSHETYSFFLTSTSLWGWDFEFAENVYEYESMMFDVHQTIIHTLQCPYLHRWYYLVYHPRSVFDPMRISQTVRRSYRTSSGSTQRMVRDSSAAVQKRATKFLVSASARRAWTISSRRLEKKELF